MTEWVCEPSVSTPGRTPTKLNAWPQQLVRKTHWSPWRWLNQTEVQATAHGSWSTQHPSCRPEERGPIFPTQRLVSNAMFWYGLCFQPKYFIWFFKLLNFGLGCSWLTVSWQFQVNHGGAQPYVYLYPFSPKRPSPRLPRSSEKSCLSSRVDPCRLPTLSPARWTCPSQTPKLSYPPPPSPIHWQP